MEKKDIYDALEDFSQILFITLAEVDALKKHIQSVIEENTSLRLENYNLRKRLEQKEQSKDLGKEKLVDIYQDGFHICHYNLGLRKDDDQPCMFCEELFYREDLENRE